MTIAEDQGVLVKEVAGAVTILRLNRPARANALDRELSDALGRALADAESDPDVGCVVITGSGERAFCAGMDLRGFANGGRPTGADPEASSAFSRLMRGEAAVPTVAAVNATAVAGGFELVLGCDMAVASERAQFALPETRRGLFAAGAGVFLGARIPLPVALELNLTGEPIGARRAHELGLVNRVVEPSQVLPEAVRLAQAVAANAPLAVAAARRILRASETDRSRAEILWREWQPRVFASDDAREGSAAFIAKRAPVWTGH